MDENQNGTYGEEIPHTYGEESKLYENGNIQDAEAAPQSGNQVNPYLQPYGGQPGNQQNPYQQSYGSQPGNQQNPYQQSYGNQPGNQQNPYGQSYGSQQNPYQQPYGNQPGGQQSPYQQPYNPYQQPYGNQSYYGMQPMPGAVKDIFCYILLVIMPLRILVSFPILKEVFISYESLMNGRYSAVLTSGSYAVYGALSNLLFIAYIVFVILDIVNVHKGGYKITGLILFAIFLSPGYYIWRAYVLRREKTVPVIYTVAYALIMVGYFFYAFYLSFSMVFNMM